MRNIIVGLAIAAVSFAHGAIVEKKIEYKSGDTVCEGVAVYDDQLKKPTAAVIVVHAWGGLGEYEIGRAHMLAQMGYVAFCADIYGKGIRPTEVSAKSAQAGKYKADRQLYRDRLMAALNTTKKLPHVDSKRIAAIGYCFGGTGVLEYARMGAGLKGIVSFHGGLDANPGVKNVSPIKTKMLVCHGADDPFVPAPQVDAFRKEMTGAPLTFIAYPGAVHSFTEKAAGNNNAAGAAYNENADKKSWEAMKRFLQGVLN